MKKLVGVVLLLALLCGCSGSNGGFERAMALRTRLLNGQLCQFDAQITADFGESTYTFVLNCQADGDGNVDFTVAEPVSIAGITGRIQGQGGKLTFDDTALAFPLLADGILSPVSGPWVLVRALRSGYVRNMTEEAELLRLRIDDSYETDALALDIWLDEQNGPVRADIYEENRRIMVLEVKNFQLQ